MVNTGGEPHFRRHVAGCFEEEFEDVERMFTLCGICIQSSNAFYHKGKFFLDSVWF
jgi:hypothetical protein